MIIDCLTGQLLAQSQVNDILQLLCNDHERILDVIQDHLNDEQICSVLCSPDPATGKEVILKSLLENNSSVTEVGDQLEKLIPLSNDQAKLRTIISEIKAGA